MSLKPLARAVHNALQYIGEQWRVEQWHRDHEFNRWMERGE